jgi:hypothetical protein
MAELITPPRYDRALTLDEVKAIPESDMPIFMYCDGGSLFGWLIRGFDKSAASHLQVLYKADTIATQSWWFSTIPIDNIESYNVKLINNPTWTAAEKKVLNDAIEARLALGRWKTRYDVWGVIGEALNWSLGSKRYDFCSEAISRFVRLIDPVFDAWLKDHPSPTPREFNVYTKQHNPPYKVYGKYMVDDACEAIEAAIVESKEATEAIKDVPATVDEKEGLVKASEKVTADLKDAKEEITGKQ